jgi:Holliday junction resolvase
MAGKGGGQSSHTRSPRQEREIAKRVGGAVTRGSGSGNEKGDVRVYRVCRIEAKTTKNKSFSVTREMVGKIENAAMCNGELPALVIEFNEEGRKVCEVAVVPMWCLELITQFKETK